VSRHLDPVEVAGLAAELEKVLFPGRPIGQIALMTFEGDEQAVLQFAACRRRADRADGGRGLCRDPPAASTWSPPTASSRCPSTREEAKTFAEDKAVEKKQGLAAATTIAKEPGQGRGAGPSFPWSTGLEPALKPKPRRRSWRPPVGPAAAASAAPAPKPKPAPAAKVVAPPPPAETGWWGVYDLGQDAFVGSAIGLRADLVGPPPEADDKLLKRDLICLTDVQAALKTAAVRRDPRAVRLLEPDHAGLAGGL
jgi:hypothetical protein